MPDYNKYQDFSESDFLNDEFFQDWIFSPDEEINQFWTNFLSDHPGKAVEISHVRMLLESIKFKESFPTDEKVREYLKKTLASIDQADTEKSKGSTRSLYIRWWAAAASVIVILSVGYLILKNQNSRQVAKVALPSDLKNDAAPGGNKAILTLGNGQTILLDSTGIGTLTTQGSSTISKLADGQIAYKESDKSADKEIIYNTISTPRGGQYKLTLSDGSLVWLNAASSLRFPATFSGEERRVELTGEGYFEVAHNKEKPFKVSINKSEIEVLGTHFNINGYTDENNLKTTLLEGSVKVSKGLESVLIKPGQQAVVNNSSEAIVINQQVNLEEIVAWKNGLFQFDDTNIKSVMRQIGRWYDLNVVFEGNVPDKKITGKIYRNVNVSKVLEIMEALKIHFKIEGKTIIVTK